MSSNLPEDIEWQIPFFTIRKDKYEKINLKNVENCIPIIIKDIPNITLSPSFAGILSFRGVQFRYVMIYGRSNPGRSSLTDHILHYDVDDGSGRILVKFPQKKIHYKNKLMINNLENELKTYCKKGGLPKSNDVKCNAQQRKELVKSMEVILNKIKRNALPPKTHYPLGSKVSVIGFPFKSIFTGEVILYAIELLEHKELCPDKELFFRKNVIDFYQRTINYKKEG